MLIRVLNLPGDADGREIGLWLGLLATLGIIAGGLVAMRDERRSPQGRHTDVSGRSRERPARDRDAARAAARGRLLTFERLRISDWVVFVAALALLFTTAAPVWYSTKAGDEARRVQQEAQPEEGQPSGQAEAEVEREAGALADNAEKTAWEADGTIDRIILICIAAHVGARRARRLLAGERAPRRAASAPTGCAG